MLLGVEFATILLAFTLHPVLDISYVHMQPISLLFVELPVLQGSVDFLVLSLDASIDVVFFCLASHALARKCLTGLLS
jgi:hypothetical protein